MLIGSRPLSLTLCVCSFCYTGLAVGALEPILIEHIDRPSDSPSAPAHTHLDVEQSTATGLRTLAQLLANQPSIQVRQIGGSGSYSDLSFRGSSADQVLIYLDGLLLNNATANTIDLSQIPLHSLQSVEIFRHQAPLDSQAALGTVVHLHSKKGQGRDQIGAQWGAFGEQQWSYSGRRQNTHWRSAFQFSHQQADNDFELLNDNQTRFNPFDDQLETRHNNATSLLYAQGHLRYQLNHLESLALHLNGSEKHNQLPNPSNSPALHADFKQRQFRLRGVWQQQSDFVATQSREWSLNLQQNNESFVDRDDQIGLDGQDNRYRLRRIQLGLSQQLGPLSEHTDWQLSTQVEWGSERYRSLYRLKSLGYAENTQDYQRDSLNLTLLAPWAPAGKKWQITPRWQGQVLQDSSPGRSRSETVLQHLSLSWLHRWRPAFSTELNISQRQKAPGFGQRYADHGLTVGNAELKNESVREISLALQQHGPVNSAGIHWQQLRLDSYFREYQQLIVNSYDSQGVGRYENLGESRIAGLELQGQFETAGPLEWTLAASTNRNIVNSDLSAFDRKQIPNIARQQQSLLLNGPWWGGWRAFYRMQRQQGVFYDRANLLPRADESRHDLGIRYQWDKGHWLFKINNVKDQASEAFNGYPGPGRSWAFEIKTTL